MSIRLQDSLRHNQVCSFLGMGMCVGAVKVVRMKIDELISQTKPCPAEESMHDILSKELDATEVEVTDISG